MKTENVNQIKKICENSFEHSNYITHAFPAQSYSTKPLLTPFKCTVLCVCVCVMFFWEQYLSGA